MTMLGYDYTNPVGRQNAEATHLVGLQISFSVFDSELKSPSTLTPSSLAAACEQVQHYWAKVGTGGSETKAAFVQLANDNVKAIHASAMLWTDGVQDFGSDLTRHIVLFTWLDAILTAAGSDKAGQFMAPILAEARFRAIASGVQTLAGLLDLSDMSPPSAAQLARMVGERDDEADLNEGQPDAMIESGKRMLLGLSAFLETWAELVQKTSNSQTVSTHSDLFDTDTALDLLYSEAGPLDDPVLL